MLFVHRLAALVAVAIAAPTGHTAEADSSAVSAQPTISITGGSTEQRETVTAAVGRYLSVGLLLPDLDVRIHVGKQGCDGKQGLFHPERDVAVIDLCFGGEFLALHELGHAWERFNLDDQDRAAFQRLTGATTWRATDVAWGRRGAERAANTMANGLLSTRLESLHYHADDFALFVALTGIASPRIHEVLPAAQATTSVDDGDPARLAAYEAWRQGRAAST